MTVEDLRIERECPRCHYSIAPGYLHKKQVQPEGSNVVVCSLIRAPAGMVLRGPMVEVLDTYLRDITVKAVAGVAGFVADMQAQHLHVGLGMGPSGEVRCVTCDQPWPCSLSSNTGEQR